MIAWTHRFMQDTSNLGCYYILHRKLVFNFFVIKDHTLIVGTSKHISNKPDTFSAFQVGTRIKFKTKLGIDYYYYYY